MKKETPQENVNQDDDLTILHTEAGEKNQLKKLAVLLILLVSIGLVIGGYFFIKNTAPSPTEGGVVQSVDEDFSERNIYTYYIEDNAVYFYNREVVGADPSSFQKIENGHYWAKDKNNVYLSGRVQANLDPSTIKVHSNTYVSDRSKVWVYGDTFPVKVEETDADPDTFAVVGYGYGKDRNNVYYGSSIVSGADVESFTYVESGYAKDKNNVYFNSSTAIPNAHAKSFVYLKDGYAKDKLNIYYRGVILANADTDSFTLLDDYYAKDVNYVFSDGEILDIAIDAASFEIVSRGVFKDSQRVYFKQWRPNTYKLIEGADALTFQNIGICKCVERSCGNYFKDKDTIYLDDEPAEFLDVSSFQYFGAYSVYMGVPYAISYAKDKSSVYHSCGVNLENANSDTFRDLKDGYAEDGDTVWYLASILENADINSFEGLGEGYAKDKNHAYFMGVIIESADVASFEIVVESVSEDAFNYDVYAKDKNSVYSRGEIIKGVDSKNCTVETIESCSLAN